MTVRITPDRFDPGAELAAFETAQDAASGAVVTFLGRVRGPAGSEDYSLTLEHYPGMAEREITAILAEARTRWQIADALVIHRFGRLVPGEPIVFVATAAAHRGDAFLAASFIMDYLKTRAPFWKKEADRNGASWVEARASDDDAAKSWMQEGARPNE